ncbi:MAG TPA: DoxX family protein [Rhizomicrobium sp.]|nr:DoxX family protein [Rhizomicrobium sp.]
MMHEIPSLVPQLVALVIGGGGLVHLAGPRPLRQLLAEWGYGRGFNWVTGAFTVAAGVFLALPQLRIWGVVLSAFLLFGTTVLLLDHRKYLFALPSILLLGALPLTLVAS